MAAEGAGRKDAAAYGAVYLGVAAVRREGASSDEEGADRKTRQRPVGGS